MSKIVVVVKERIPSLTGTIEHNLEKAFENVNAFNNERGELIIDKVEVQKGTENDVYPVYHSLGTVAVFKEWLYWEKIK